MLATSIEERGMEQWTESERLWKYKQVLCRMVWGGGSMRHVADIDEMLLLHPSWNTVEGVYELCESRGEKTCRRNESERGWKLAIVAQPGDRESIWISVHSEHKSYDPKDVWSKRGQGKVRGNSDGGPKHYWRTTRLSELRLGAKYQSNHLRSGSLRSFPQNSWDS